MPTNAVFFRLSMLSL